MRPLEAYEAVMRFSAERGEPTLHLALHAAVPQTFRPDLLHLIRLNFVPEAPHEAEADVLLAPFCEDIGGGYYQLDPEARRLLLVHLDPTYSEEKIARVQRVADFLVTYIATQRRRLSADQDRLAEDYLSIQGWVALAFLQPEAAALQLAAALDQGTQGEIAARVQFSGLSSALSVPLVRYPKLLTYAAGVEALEQGRGEDAVGLLERLPDEEIRIGGVTLRSPRKLLARREAEREEQKAEKASVPSYKSCFISYPYGDRDFVTWLRPTLQSRGVRVWTAPDDVEEGQAKHKQITEAIQTADTFLVVVSRKFPSSGGARFETELARKAGRPIIYLIIDSLQDVEGLFVPDSTTVDFKRPLEEGLKSLLQLLMKDAPDEPQPVEAEAGFIYLSYAPEDREIARSLRRDFERAGLRVWDDPRLETAVGLDERIRKYIEKSVVFVPLLSQHTLAQKGRSFEWRLAVSRADLAIVPVVLDDTVLREQTELPALFQQLPWFRLRDDGNRRLVKVLQDLIRERQHPPTPS